MLVQGEYPPVMGIVEHLNDEECRFRSLGRFDAGDVIRFDISPNGTAAVSLTGTVVSCTTTGPRRNYVLRFGDAKNPQPEPRIIPARHAARAPQAAPSPLVRSAVRVPADFAVGFAHENGSIGSGYATNISEGGMHMVSSAELLVGAALELTFILPESGAQESVVEARIVARQATGDGRRSYNMAFFNLDKRVHTRIAAYVRTKQP
jgi:hypothetical protein